MSDELPKSNAEIVELAKWTKGRCKDDPEAHTMFVSYLLTHGFGRLRLRNVLMPVWKEAAECIEVTGEDGHRAIMLMLTSANRTDIMRMLERAAAGGELSIASVPLLLEEWDALKFPNQLPPPVRERALERHRRAVGAEG